MEIGTIHGTRYSLPLMQTRALPLSGSVQARQPAPTPTSGGGFPVAPDTGEGPARLVDAATGPRSLVLAASSSDVTRA